MGRQLCQLYHPVQALASLAHTAYMWVGIYKGMSLKQEPNSLYYFLLFIINYCSVQAPAPEAYKLCNTHHRL